MLPAEKNPLLSASSLRPGLNPAGWVHHIMKCPYCAEEIKDEATFCHHCHHDFGLVKPLLARLILAEKKVEKLSADIVSVSGTGQAASFLVFTAAVAVVLGIILTSGYFVSGRGGGTSPYVLAIALPPAILGLLVGLVAGQRSPWTFFTSGFLLGTVNFLLIALMLGTVTGVKFQWPLAFVTLVIGQAFTFATMALFGNSLRRSGWALFRKLSADDLVSRAKRFNDAVTSLTAFAATMGLAYKWISEALT